MKYIGEMKYLLVIFVFFCLAISIEIFHRPVSYTICNNAAPFHRDISQSTSFLDIIKEFGLDNEDDTDKLFLFSKAPFLMSLKSEPYPIFDKYSESHIILDILSRSPPCA